LREIFPPFASTHTFARFARFARVQRHYPHLRVILKRWAGIHARCGKRPGYFDVECRYRDFDDFCGHMIELGFRPSLTIDRINPFAHYERSNVRLATVAEQASNKRMHHGGQLARRKNHDEPNDETDGYRIHNVVWYW
jgi:hypothetical protein